MDFVDSLGPAFLAHRLRRLSDLMVDQVGAALLRDGLTVPARSISTLLLLRERGPLGPVEIGRALRFSHPLMVRSLRTLEALGLVEAIPDEADQRRRRVQLTADGAREADRGLAITDEVARQLSDRADEAGIDLALLLSAIDGLNATLGRHPLAISLEPLDVKR